MVLHKKGASDGRLLALVFFAGLVLRLLWQIRTSESLTIFRAWGEASNVALALADGRGFADAYYQGSGPTAHLLPLNPLAAAFWIWMFGPDSAAANLGLLAMSLAQVGLGYWLLMRVFERLGLEEAAVRWSIILLCVLPFFVQTEVIAFRYWEGATALCLMGANLLRMVELNDRPTIRRRDLLLIAALCAVTIFVSIAVGFAVTVCWAIFALRKLALKQVAGLALAGAVALTLLVAPWAIRNEAVLGHPVLLRSNAGLELALANHPAAVSGENAEAVADARFAELHPFGRAAGRDALESAGSEVLYYQRLGAAARSWIADHPGDFATLSLRHLRQFYFPSAPRFAGAEPNGWPVQGSIWVSLVNLIGLLGLLAGLIQGRKGYAMLTVCIVCITMTYVPTNPTPRYTYLVYGPLMFVAADALLRFWSFAIGAFSIRTLRPLAAGAHRPIA
jgi:hypothetical protein